MGTKKIFNIIIALLLLATAAMGCLLYITWIGVREENIERRLDESRLLYQLNKLSDEKKYNEEYYRRLVYDEAFAERVIREKMGYVGKNEIVFRFKDSTPVSVDTRMSPKFFPRLDASKPAPKLSPETLDEEVEEAEPPQNQIFAAPPVFKIRRRKNREGNRAQNTHRHERPAKRVGCGNKIGQSAGG